MPANLEGYSWKERDKIEERYNKEESKPKRSRFPMLILIVVICVIIIKFIV